jgi:hypothetical protein
VIRSDGLPSRSLAMRTPAIRFEGRAGTAQAIVQSLAGVTPPSEPVSDSKTFRVDLAPATLFDFLNATILAHGEMTWEVEESDEAQQRGVSTRGLVEKLHRTYQRRPRAVVTSRWRLAGYDDQGGRALH